MRKVAVIVVREYDEETQEEVLMVSHGVEDDTLSTIILPQVSVKEAVREGWLTKGSEGYVLI